MSEIPMYPDEWRDTRDEWSTDIDAAHPTRSGSHDEYGIAMQMVGHRHSKGELVELVNWLLVRLRPPTIRAICYSCRSSWSGTTKTDIGPPPTCAECGKPCAGGCWIEQSVTPQRQDTRGK